MRILIPLKIRFSKAKHATVRYEYITKTFKPQVKNSFVATCHYCDRLDLMRLFYFNFFLYAKC